MGCSIGSVTRTATYHGGMSGPTAHQTTSSGPKRLEGKGNGDKDAVCCTLDHDDIHSAHPLSELRWDKHSARRQYTRCTSPVCGLRKVDPEFRCQASSYRTVACMVTHMAQLAQLGKHLGEGLTDAPKPQIGPCCVSHWQPPPS